MKPQLPITDKRFQYTPACATDIRKTFERMKQTQQKADVLPIKKVRTK